MGTVAWPFTTQMTEEQLKLVSSFSVYDDEQFDAMLTFLEFADGEAYDEAIKGAVGHRRSNREHTERTRRLLIAGDAGKARRRLSM